jgi:integrase
MKRSSTFHYVDHSLAASTCRAYASDLKHFQCWGGRIPATEKQVCGYLEAHAKTLRPSTLVRRIAAISQAHARKGLPNPIESRLVKATLKGIRRVHGLAPRQATALSPAAISQIVSPIEGYGRARNLRDAALLLLGFSGGFRRSELAALKAQDFTFVREGVIVRLRKSKTDPNSKGRDVAIPYTKTQCAARALRTWIQHCGVEASSEQPVFCKIDKHDHVAGKPLTAAAVGWILLRRMRLKEMDTRGFSAHSLRAGFVTSAARAGVPTWAIQRHTGHRSEQMVHRYIRGIGLFELNASKALFTPTTKAAVGRQRNPQIKGN